MKTIIWLNVKSLGVVPFWDKKGKAIIGFSQKACDLVDGYVRDRGIYDMIAGAIRYIEFNEVNWKSIKRLYIVNSTEFMALDFAIRIWSEETDAEIGMKDVCQILPEKYEIPFPEEVSIPEVGCFRIIEIDGEIFNLGLEVGFLNALTEITKLRNSGTTLRVSGLGDIAAQDYIHKDISYKVFPEFFEDLEEIQE